MPSVEPLSFSSPVSPLDVNPLLKEAAISHSPIDTLEMDSLPSKDWKPERPQLISPHDLPSVRKLSDQRLLKVTKESRELGDELLGTLGFRLGIVKDKVKEISAENMQKLRESAERAQSSTWWAVLKKVATCLLSTFSIVFGAAVAATGGGALIGGAMITSGILSLTNFALSETGAWDWISKKLANQDEEWANRLAWILPAAVGILAGGIGVVGSVHSLATSAIQFADKAIFIAQSALGVFDGLVTLGKGQADARLVWAQADTMEVQAKLNVEDHHFDNVMKGIEGNLAEFRTAKSHAKKIISTLTTSNIKLVRQA
jgi:hypothetical protein